MLHNSTPCIIRLFLRLQAEAVRIGTAEASNLSDIVTEKLLQPCTAAQLVDDVLWLQGQLKAEVAAGNPVKASLWQQLLSICQVCRVGNVNLQHLNPKP